jgi:hypothetical protein
MATPKKKSKGDIKDAPVKLNMTFEQAMKKALNTPLPAKNIKKK